MRVPVPEFPRSRRSPYLATRMMSCRMFSVLLLFVFLELFFLLVLRHVLDVLLELIFLLHLVIFELLFLGFMEFLEITSGLETRNFDYTSVGYLKVFFRVPIGPFGPREKEDEISLANPSASRGRREIAKNLPLVWVSWGHRFRTYDGYRCQRDRLWRESCQYLERNENIYGNRELLSMGTLLLSPSFEIHDKAFYECKISSRPSQYTSRSQTHSGKKNSLNSLNNPFGRWNRERSNSFPMHGNIGISLHVPMNSDLRNRETFSILVIKSLSVCNAWERFCVHEKKFPTWWNHFSLDPFMMRNNSCSQIKEPSVFKTLAFQ